jgi:hypothetical protein
VKDQAVSTSPTAARIALGLLVFPLLAVIAVFNLRALQDVDELVRHGVQAQALVTGTNCGNHGSLGYSFEHLGETHRGSGTSCVARCEAARAGDSVVIQFVPDNPSNSACGSIPELRMRVVGDNVLHALVALGAGVLIFLVTTDGKKGHGVQ